MTHSQPTAHDAEFVGSIPESYDRHLRPLLFDGAAVDLAQRVVLPPGRATAVLEVGAGTGALTRHLRARLPADAWLTATDLNEPMLDVAEMRLNALGLGRGVWWRVADAMALPFDSRTFDVVISQLAMMFIPDKPRAAREAFRVLEPGGQWLFSVLGSWDENAYGRVVYEAIASFFPGHPPQFYHVPFTLHDPDALRALAVDAGFGEPEITVVDRVAETESADDAAAGFVFGNPVLPEALEHDVAKSEKIRELVAERLARSFGDHPLRFPMRVRIVSARKPVS